MKKRIALLIGLLAGVLVLSAASVFAQGPEPTEGPAPQGQPAPPHPPMDPLADAMFPPEMVMMHTRELDLTPDQKNFMRAEINKATTRFNELQWQLQDAMEALHDTMKANPVNEQQALAQLDKVLDTEREIKHLHIAMGIRIKNQLTPAQQEKLMAMHAMMGPGRGLGHGRGDGRGPDGPGRRPGGPGGPNGPGGEPGPGGPPPGMRP